ncbi:MAG TPA: hypothetical protein VM431_00700 [Phycisphaerae bacterium]|nr:hypothetical protein [Phycisphaerae bacterium]
MKRLFTLMMLLLCAALLAGCGGVLPGFRYAPSEPQRQVAQAGADLAQVAAASGLPPGSPAVRQMAGAARASAAYAGPPSEPVDISDLVPPAVTNAWNLMERRAEALELKGDVLERTADVASEALADLATDIDGQAKVDGDRVVFRSEAIVQAQKMGAAIADAIPIPGLDDMSPEEAKRMQRIDAALKKVQAAASAQAARRPTTAEVVEAAEGQALDTIDRVVDVLEDYGLLALIPGAAGMALYVKKRREALKAAEDAKFARTRETEAKAAADKAAAETARIMLSQLTAAAPAVETPTES